MSIYTASKAAHPKTTIIELTGMTQNDELAEPAQQSQKNYVRQKPLRHKTVMLVVRRALYNLLQKSKNEYIVLSAAKLLMAYKDPMRGVRAIIKRGNITSDELDARQNEDAEHAFNLAEAQSLLADFIEAKARRVGEPQPLGQHSTTGSVNPGG